MASAEVRLVLTFVTAGHGKKKKKWQKDEPEEAAATIVPAGPKKEVPKPYMADAKYVTSEFRTTGTAPTKPVGM